MKTLLQIFTWWNGSTIGTRFWTSRKGERVGEDEFGNVYYRTKGGAVDPTIGVQRRWVQYNGYAEATAIPPGWWGWMHHQIDTPPSETEYKPRDWQKPHRPNQTGTVNAYHPKGSMLSHGHRQAATGDYQAWSPGD
ncbi:NADH:ubiquinone oxidoreductase subunit NDUFA12 [Labrys sp. KB_33_2]|uniref:NADH:ubiquinone oxidoreductase subunit NDUFA12 n=1 Tax=unclassified Labrys (in: a-proteobacteria) TaxID=2688601 RepID=UPI003EBE7033